MIGGSYPLLVVIVVSSSSATTKSLTIVPCFRLPHDDSFDERFVLLPSTVDLGLDDDFVNGLNSIIVRKSKDFGR
jgi:hypothetical protein